MKPILVAVLVAIGAASSFTSGAEIVATSPEPAFTLGIEEMFQAADTTTVTEPGQVLRRTQILIEAMVLDVLMPDSNGAGGNNSERKPPGRVELLFKSSAVLNANVLWMTNFASGTSNIVQGGKPSEFCYVAGLGNDLDSMIPALASNRWVNIVSRPRILTSHAVSARIYLVAMVHAQEYSKPTSYSDSAVSPSLIELEVTPLIEPEGVIALGIRQNIGEATGSTNLTGAGDAAATSSTESQARVTVHDGDTIMIGGMIWTSKPPSSGIPVLKHIPLLGRLFRGYTARQQLTEAVVLLRPSVITNSDATVQAGKEGDKVAGVKPTRELSGLLIH